MCCRLGCCAYSFFTLAAPGVGKTIVIQATAALFKRMGCETVITASTGMAATRVKGGRTLHSFIHFTPAILEEIIAEDDTAREEEILANLTAHFNRLQEPAQLRRLSKYHVCTHVYTSPILFLEHLNITESG